jgi:hypothetical protein
MSTANFDPRDRADHRQTADKFDGKKWSYRDLDPGHGVLRFMARSGGYVMVRRPRCAPFVLTEKEWAKLPLWADKSKKQRDG